MKSIGNSSQPAKFIPSKKGVITSPVLLEAWYEGVHYICAHEPDGSRRLIAPLPATQSALMAPPIAFVRAYVKATRSLSAALMLSHAVGESDRLAENLAEGWFVKSAEEWQSETSLTRAEQITARRVLKEIGVLEERLAGQPAKLHFRVEKARIYDLIHASDCAQRVPDDLSAGTLLEMFGEVIAVNRAYIHLTGNVAAGVFLSFLQDTIDSHPESKAAGWFIMPISEVLRKTGLSMFELCSARRLLSEANLAVDSPPSNETDGHIWLLNSEQVEHVIADRTVAELAEIEDMAKLIGLI